MIPLPAEMRLLGAPCYLTYTIYLTEDLFLGSLSKCGTHANRPFCPLYAQQSADTP
jgi:hypothetical protein